ncbi:MFS transporter [Pedobacter miscanthi]|uniref:MFS transporter n=1 Tax=Pedobacter miscanthi TaxID=2259170 RepID=UPI00292E8093|nr:MFS transporter [Pedobacter miscanthi]
MLGFSKNYRWWALLLISSGVFLSVIDIFIVNVAIPSIKKGIHGTDGDSQLFIALYLIGYASFLITGGRMGDHFGRKKVFIIAMLVFTSASVVCGVAQTPTELITARFIQGIGSAFMVPQGIALIQILFPEHNERIKALGVYGSIAGTASVIGQFLGGLLPDIHFIAAGWRLIFLINLPIGLLAIALSARFLKESNQKKAVKFDYSGIAILSIALVSFTYLLIRGRELGWPLWSILLMIGALLMIWFFISDQKKKLASGNDPLINVELFNYKDFNIGLLAVFFYYLVQESYFFVNTLLFQNGLGISSSQTGILFACQGIGYVVASLLSIRLVGVFGKRVLQSGVLLMIVALVFHVIVLEAKAVNQLALMIVLFGYGIGCGSVLPSLLTITLRRIPTHFAGAASGTYSTVQQTAIALGVVVVVGLFLYVLSGHKSLSGYLHAYRLATACNILFLMAVAFFLWLIPDKED